MRKEPREQSEMVSQLLFGECYKVINEITGWIEIVTSFDHYQGWIDSKLFMEISESFYKTSSAQLPPVLDSLLMNIGLPGAQPLTIFAGSSLPGCNAKNDRIIIEDRVFQIYWTVGKTNTRGSKTLPEIIGMFLNSPYLWGGRTTFGCDCSGFVQTAFKMTGIALRRDASQQAEQGKVVDSLSEALRRSHPLRRNHERRVLDGQVQEAG
jgi:hypothetical protein